MVVSDAVCASVYSIDAILGSSGCFAAVARAFGRAQSAVQYSTCRVSTRTSGETRRTFFACGTISDQLSAIADMQAHLTATLTKLDAKEVTQNERVAAQEEHAARVSAAAAASSTNGGAVHTSARATATTPR